MNDLTDVIEKWLNDNKIKLIENYYRLNLKASGNWERELETFSEVSETKIRLGFTGSYYTYWLQNGRKPTKKGSEPGKLKDIISQWIKDKGIKARDGISHESLTFLITRKIHKRGWPPGGENNKGARNRLVTHIINKRSITALLSEISGVLKAELKSDIINNYNKKI